VAHAQTQFVAMLPTSVKNALGLLKVAHALTQDDPMLPKSGKSSLGLYIVAHAQRWM
jgi:hypothetical protein